MALPMSISLFTKTNDSYNFSDPNWRKNVSKDIEKDVSMTDMLFCFDS